MRKLNTFSIKQKVHRNDDADLVANKVDKNYVTDSQVVKAIHFPTKCITIVKASFTALTMANDVQTVMSKILMNLDKDCNYDNLSTPKLVLC